MSIPLQKVTITSIFVLVLSFAAVSIASAAGYVPLVGLPAIAGREGNTLGEYFNQLYMFTVALGALLAFLKIAFAGAKYSLSEVVTSKADAKKDIQGALLGLAILLVPFIVLNTIYPGLTNLNVLKDISVLKVTPPTGVPGGGTSPSPIPPGTTVKKITCEAKRATGGSAVSAEFETGGETVTYDCEKAIAECQALGVGASYTQGDAAVDNFITCTNDTTAAANEAARLCSRTPGGATYNYTTNTCTPTSCTDFRNADLATPQQRVTQEKRCTDAGKTPEYSEPGSGQIRICCK